ncbi:molybdopterin synthase catalytic subunit-like [Paramacrobiotus metropolitanus]|uniref:molybdopterin synthase catalytic subunit-like n=1 Tax=Paramacrobiotus metropolitanus TaxID=2943436 RepID=UPI00244626D7|nr:molybdopterin synthase catalytic subunit-like [Paramacrobiotus metropolitanus]XP_055334932.1 molybdopterin synthase catalytic subunit-like [Paramacrobiotus metropolitanus]XP_055334933.1 molybdopterin synthase catalytic subunit-like [Paramacrobiotus metropolitanus]
MDFINIANDNQPLSYYIEKLMSAADCHVLLAALETVSVSPELDSTKTNGKEIKMVQFDMHIAKAEQKMKEICCTIRAKWNAVRNIVLVHRIGYVFPSCPYSFVGIIGHESEEVRQALDVAVAELKKLPLWKEETYTDDSRCWTSTSDCFWRMNAEEREELDRLQASAAKTKSVGAANMDTKGAVGCADPKCCIRNGRIQKTEPDISLSKNVL